MTNHPGACQDVNLAVLLDGEEDSEAFRSISSHLDSCLACQRRLTEMSAAEDHWNVQREMLQPVEGDRPDTGLLSRYHSPEYLDSQRSGLDECALKELLSAPSHPEMLGRLGRYEIERVIGTGGMGIVLKGIDSELNRPVAIKLLAPHLARVGTARQRFAREARAAAAVVHEHVVPIHDVDSSQPTPFLVMQLIPGESLEARVEREGPLSVAEILRIGLQAASGLAAAHAQGLVHRDVKPANILLENTVERAYLTDFGLARAADDTSLTYTGVIPGTPHYMSPEQADGQPLDFRSDLFSLGSVLYFMATGHPPFRGDRPMAVLKRTCHDRHHPVRQFNAEIPEALSAVIDRLLEKDPARRFPNASELQIELARILAEVQQGKHRRSRRLGPTLWLGVGGLLAVASLGATIAWWQLRDSETGHFGDPSEHPPVQASDVESAMENLLFVDPSPPFRSRMELNELSRVLDLLETMPYPETKSKE